MLGPVSATDHIAQYTISVKAARTFFLVRARRHLTLNDPPSAANYTRSRAFEWKIKGYCDKFSVKVPYKNNPGANERGHFLAGCEDPCSQQG